ncbi:MAG: hypothetical protein WBN77_04800 [Desulfobacterales bacterium]
MPGIVGIISKTPQEKKHTQNVQLMVHAMMHEPFYSSSIYTNDKLGVYAGWICHKDSFSDCMPIWNEKKNLVMLFFGENFTDKETFDHLKSKNHKFDNSNASYIIHLYEEKGIDFLKDLNGCFSGLLIDIQAEKVFLFNDRYGMQRIYYYENNNAFYFSSEAKALLRICPELRKIDMKGLGEYLCYNCVLENRSLFQNIYLLPCASVWKFQMTGLINKAVYFTSDEWENQPWLEKEFFYEKLKETFIKILPRYFRTNQKIGISLTSGLDTRIIMANIDMQVGKYPCYTFGGTYRDSFDVQTARKISNVCHQTHQVFYLDKKFLNDFSIYADKTVYITDGCLGVVGTPIIYTAALAREIAPISMTGNHGGNILRGEGGILKATPPSDNLFNSEFKKYIHQALIYGDYLRHNKYDTLSFNLFTKIPWYKNAEFIGEQTQLIRRSPYLDSDFVSLMYRAPTDFRNNKELSLRLMRDGNPSLRNIPTDRGYNSNQNFPFSMLTHLHRECVFKAEHAYSEKMSPWLAKLDHIFMLLHFERLFLGYHEYAHFRTWYRNELADYVQAILLDEKTLNRPFLNRVKLEKIVLDHTKGYCNNTTEISKILSVELIHRLLIENY